MESIKYPTPTVDPGDSVTMDNKHASNQNDPEYICIHFRAVVCLLLLSLLDPQFSSFNSEEKKILMYKSLPIKKKVLFTVLYS